MSGKVSKQKALDLLNRRLDELNAMKPKASRNEDTSTFDSWQTNTKHTLQNIFIDTKYLDFDRIYYSLMGFSSRTPDSKFVEAHNNGRKQAKSLLEAYIKEVEEFWEEPKEVVKSVQKTIQEIKPKPDKSKVFIVHGHDDAMKLEVARFVERLDFEAIILHEQASEGKTIIEKIEANTNVGFGIVLYSPCDEGRAKSADTLNPRARQNVVFEHGYLIARLERKNVVALVKGEVETPGDISGVVYVPMNGDWKIDIAKELKKAGYSVDFNKLY